MKKPILTPEDFKHFKPNKEEILEIIKRYNKSEVGMNKGLSNQQKMTDYLLSLISLMEIQNKLLQRNTIYTGGAFFSGLVALIISVICLIQTL